MMFAWLDVADFVVVVWSRFGDGVCEFGQLLVFLGFCVYGVNFVVSAFGNSVEALFFLIMYFCAAFDCFVNN